MHSRSSKPAVVEDRQQPGQALDDLARPGRSPPAPAGPGRRAGTAAASSCSRIIVRTLADAHAERARRRGPVQPLGRPGRRGRPVSGALAHGAHSPTPQAPRAEPAPDRPLSHVQSLGVTGLDRSPAYADAHAGFHSGSRAPGVARRRRTRRATPSPVQVLARLIAPPRRHRRPPPHRTHDRRSPGHRRRPRRCPRAATSRTVHRQAGRHRDRPRRALPRLDRRADLPQPPRQPPASLRVGQRIEIPVVRAAARGPKDRGNRQPNGHQGTRATTKAAPERTGRPPRRPPRPRAPGAARRSPGHAEPPRRRPAARRSPSSWQESGWQMHRASSADAIGAMQVLPEHRAPGCRCTPVASLRLRHTRDNVLRRGAAARRARRPHPLPPAPGRRRTTRASARSASTGSTARPRRYVRNVRAIHQRLERGLPPA